MGRPTDYREEYNEQAFKLCLLGATDKELADFFGVCEATINNWKNDYPLFLESLKNGKTTADAEIAASLFKRAKGAIVTQEQAFKMKSTSFEDGKKSHEEEVIEIVELKQELPPDTSAAIFWLKNRQPDKWREKREPVEIDAEDGEITINVRRVGKDAN